MQCSPCSAQGDTPVSVRPSAQDAYREVLAWGQGVSQDRLAQYISTNTEQLDALYDRVERGAYRYNIIPEFALAVIAAESIYGHQISWARHDSWAVYEMTTGSNLTPPSVYDDLDTALSELRMILSQSETMDQVFAEYWCGPLGKFNSSSLGDYQVAVSKLWGALEPYAEERKQNEDRGKYDSSYYNKPSKEPSWAGLAYGDLTGYSSSIGAMPSLAAQLKDFGEYEQTYAAAIQGINKKLSNAEATVIARAILTYTEQTSHGDHVSYWVDPRLVMAVVRAESAFKPRAVSKVGAMGLGQLMPATAKSMGIKNAFDPVQNLYGCVKYLERERYRWRNSVNWLELVLASYNAGAGAVQKYKGVPPYKETQSFVKIVKGYYRKFGGE